MRRITSWWATIRSEPANRRVGRFATVDEGCKEKRHVDPGSIVIRCEALRGSSGVWDSVTRSAARP
jgi:hypothetical protein